MPAIAIANIQEFRNTRHPISTDQHERRRAGLKIFQSFPQGASGNPRSRPPEINSPLFSVLLAAQHDDPDKQDREHGTNDSNCGSIHRRSPFLTSVISAFPALTFSGH
jgi:hypothetical protein